MATTYFGLRARPFRSTPDTASYYPASCHEQLLARLVSAVAEDEGLLLVTGEPGTGKTLLGYRLLERLDASVASVFVTNTHLASRLDLFQALLFDLGLPYEGKSEQESRLALTEKLLETFRAGKCTLIIIDEAQHLSADLLEEVRLLCNLEASSGKAVQVLLLAQPEILQTLQSPHLTALRQRLAVRLRLEPLDVHESADYVLSQVRSCGGRPEVLFTGEAVELIARHSQGVPRVLNQIAHNALSTASAANLRQVDAEAVLEVLATLGIEAGEPAAHEPEPEPNGAFLLQQPGRPPRMVFGAASV